MNCILLNKFVGRYIVSLLIIVTYIMHCVAILVSGLSMYTLTTKLSNVKGPSI